MLRRTSENVRFSTIADGYAAIESIRPVATKLFLIFVAEWPFLIRESERYPATIYDPSQPSDNPENGKITSRQDPRLFRAAIRVSF